MTHPSYRLTLPDQHATSVVFASPHSGRDYSGAFLAASVLDHKVIRSSEDAFVDQLLQAAPQLGAPLLAALAPRAYIDLNRAEDELDPALIDGVRSFGHNPRIASGLGVIPRVVAGGRAIYSGKLHVDEANARIATYWRPYHACLADLLAQNRRQFGASILVDVHSMPHEAIDAMLPKFSPRPEIVLGDRFGASAAGDITDRIEAAFVGEGLRVARNTPFAGAYITQTYGRPSAGSHAIQIEIDRSLYMNEREIRPNGNFYGFRSLMARVLAEIVQIGHPEQRLAAE